MKAASEPLYEQVASRVATMIERGVLLPGDRIPSIRRMSREMSVAMTTVIDAYHCLEDRGLVKVRPQSGYYVLPKYVPSVPKASAPAEPDMQRLSLKPSPVKPSNFLFRTCAALAMPGVLPLGAAVPSNEFLPTKQLNRILGSISREYPETSNYQFSPGYGPLRKIIARRLASAGCTIPADEIVVTAGATEALMLSLKLLAQPGDTVVVESPCYFGLVHLLKCLDLQVIEVASDPRSGISLLLLEKLLSRGQAIKAVVINPNVHNPLGGIMDDDKKQRIVQLLSIYNIPIIEDDTYAEVSFNEVRPRCIRAFDRSNNTLLCGSFSKTISPGYRIGWVAGGKHADGIKELKLATSLASTTPTQMALARYLAGARFDRHLRRLRRQYREHVELMADAIHRHFPEKTKVTRPAGGHLLWVELSQRVNASKLFEAALERKICIAPGPIFSPTGQYANCIRLNCALPWTYALERGIATLGSLAKDQMV